jgi:hypothetical protein
MSHTYILLISLLISLYHPSARIAPMVDLCCYRFALSQQKDDTSHLSLLDEIPSCVLKDFLKYPSHSRGYLQTEL